MKVNKGSKNVTKAEVDEEADEATPVSSQAVAETESLPDVTPPPAKKNLGLTDVARIDVSQVDAKDEVLVTMFETINPAPRIGTFNIQQQLGIAELKLRKNYRLPKFVAEVLVDAGKAEYLQVN